ncbi:hypothetical protein A2419_01925 [Candidatus Adlerbacteria bacterium RIFOXYC1_FULL_48_26]|uniref:Uncharacterized protein n=1 Tax=Candidatus Adlerbacteria bacterium RIFOXYC1_FULL_48_26 TaxID=1797247 RepID=A0A1F4Y3N8_9BACT|nr:MAG: hypothetical protein A2419_01925 [Candidatus Adlerbacteria bacterium RIFOXYC1_FULL_48_26]
MQTSQQVIEQALRNAETAEPGIQPAILMNLNIDHTKVAEYQRTYLNDAWAPKTKELMDSGFIIFRIQTELGLNGHITYIYMAKMKAN